MDVAISMCLNTMFVQSHSLAYFSKCGETNVALCFEIDENGRDKSQFLGSFMQLILSPGCWCLRLFNARVCPFVHWTLNGKKKWLAPLVQLSDCGTGNVCMWRFVFLIFVFVFCLWKYYPNPLIFHRLSLQSILLFFSKLTWTEFIRNVWWECNLI